MFWWKHYIRGYLLTFFTEPTTQIVYMILGKQIRTNAHKFNPEIPLLVHISEFNLCAFVRICFNVSN